MKGIGIALIGMIINQGDEGLKVITPFLQEFFKKIICNISTRQLDAITKKGPDMVSQLPSQHGLKGVGQPVHISTYIPGIIMVNNRAL